MVNYKPASELTIRRSINIYTAVVFLSFGLLLIWLAYERYTEFIDTHNKTAAKTTEITAYEVAQIIKDKQLAMDIFIEDYRSLLLLLADNPDNYELHNEIELRLKKFFPDFFTSNIVTFKGEPVIENFDGAIGELCIADLKSFLETKIPSIRVHPNFDTYHFDVVRSINIDKGEHMFFVSFDLSTIASLLKAVQPSGHELMLIYKDNMTDLIEVLPQGARDVLIDRLDYRLTGDEKMRVLSSVPVNGTQWHVVDMYSPELFSIYIESIIKDCLLIYFLFSLTAMYMRSILMKQDKKRQSAEEQLRDSNNEIQKLNETLESLSRTDSLTGLYNRRYFDERISEEWSRCLRAKTPLTCILIDVDYFKQFNDHYGHQAGDECLKSIAKLIGKIFKRATDVIARYGGEEFVIVMSDISEKESEKVLFQFQVSLGRMNIPHVTSKITDHVTTSAGMVNMVPTKEDTIDSFILKTDMALYAAKGEGRNKIVVHGRKKPHLSITKSNEKN